MNHTPAPASSAASPEGPKVLDPLDVDSPVAAPMVAPTSASAKPLAGAGETSEAGARARDISSQHATEEALRHSHQFWQATLDTLEIGMAIFDREGRTLACNRAWHAQSWSSHKCELGQGFSSIPGGSGASALGGRGLAQSIQAVLAGDLPGFHGEFECENSGAAAEGPPRFYAVRVSRIEVPAPLLSRFESQPVESQPVAFEAASTCGSAAEVGSNPGHVMISCEEITSRRHAQDEREALARRQASAQAAREQEQRSRERSDFLARAAEVLASSLDLETTFSQAANLCVPFLADWCLIDLVEGEAFRRVAIAYSQVEAGVPLPDDEVARRSQVSKSYRRLFSIHGDVRFGVARVLQSGQSELHTTVNDEIVRHAAYDEGHLEMLRALRGHSAMCVPLSTRGRTLGTLSFVRSLPHSAGAPQSPGFSEEDLKLVEDVARVAALAVDNARLFGEAEAANRAKDDFLAVLSHELRTPLTPILGWVYLLREEKPEQDIYIRALDIIESNARAQSRLIEDLIDVSRVVTGKLSLEKRAISLSRLASDVADAVRPQAGAKELSLSLHAPEIGMVLGDEGRLRQAMSNLVGNAIKFTPPGGRVEMHVETVIGAAGESLARFEVRDSGRGIEAQFLPRLFERFEQADASSSRGEGGLGLGLTIVRHIARLHGGEVRAASLGLGQGSSFALELPLLPANNSLRARESQSAPPLAIEGAKILVVDDEPDAREVLETLLTRAGATIRAVSNAEQAWDVFGEWRPDIVIFDLAMPGEDGYSLMRRVRALPVSEGGLVAALAITAHARAEDRQRALDCGFHLHVAKPVDPAKLALALLELLSLART